MFKLKNFTFKYDNVSILNNVSGNFIVENEINIIFGDNGCGKTSLIEVLNLQNEQYVGEVSYLGKNYKDLSKKEKLSLKNAEFGFVPQKLNLIEDLSAIENLEIVANKKYNEEHYEKLLLKLNISKSMQTKNVKKLSGGMKQRVAIARALVNNPRIIFFDEPTANLDFKNIDNFIAIIDELKTSGVTVIIITHEDIFFEKFKYIIEVENTKVIPTYRIKEKVEEINFLKVKKPNLKIINKSQKILKILIAILIFFAMYITCFYTAPYLSEVTKNLDLSSPKEDLIYTYNPYSSYYTPDLIQTIENIDGVEQVYLYNFDPLTDSCDIDPTKCQNNNTNILYMPKNIVQEYNYIGADIITGELPADNTNEILITNRMADQLIELGIYSSYEAMIGSPFNINEIDQLYMPEQINFYIDNFDGYDAKYVISGVYDSHGDEHAPLYFAYSDEYLSNLILSKSEYQETDSCDYYCYLMNVSAHFRYIYVDLEEGVDIAKIDQDIQNQSTYLTKTTKEIHYELYTIVVAVIMYMIIFVVISIILVLITRRNNHSLAILGHAKQKIRWNNINLVNSFIILSSLVIVLSKLFDFTDVSLEQVFPITLFVTLISIVINIIIGHFNT